MSGWPAMLRTAKASGTKVKGKTLVTSENPRPAHVSVHVDAITLSGVRFDDGPVVAAVVLWADLGALLASGLFDVDADGWRHSAVFTSVPEALFTSVAELEPDQATNSVPADGITLMAARLVNAFSPGQGPDRDESTEDADPLAGLDTPDHAQIVASFMKDLDLFMAQSVASPTALLPAAVGPDGGEDVFGGSSTRTWEMGPSEYFDVTLPAGVVALLHSTMNNPSFLPLILINGTPPVNPVPTLNLTAEQDTIQVHTTFLNAEAALADAVHPGYLQPLPDVDFEAAARDPLTLQAQHTMFGSLVGSALGYPMDVARLKSLAAWVAAGFNAITEDVAAGMEIIETDQDAPGDAGNDAEGDEEAKGEHDNTALATVILALLDSAVEESRDRNRSAHQTIDPFTNSPLPATLLQPWADGANPDVLTALNTGAELPDLLGDYEAEDVIAAVCMYLSAMCALYVRPISDGPDEVPISLVMLNWLTPNDTFHQWWGLGALTSHLAVYDTRAFTDLLTLRDGDEPTPQPVILPHFLHELAKAMDFLGWNATTITSALYQSEINTPDLEDVIEIAAMLAPPDPHDPSNDEDDVDEDSDECPHHARAGALAERVTDFTRLVNGAAYLLPLLADATAVARGLTPDDDHWDPARSLFIQQVLTQTGELVNVYFNDDDD